MKQIMVFLFFVEFGCVNKPTCENPFIQLRPGDKVNSFVDGNELNILQLLNTWKRWKKDSSS